MHAAFAATSRAILVRVRPLALAISALLALLAGPAAAEAPARVALPPAVLAALAAAGVPPEALAAAWRPLQQGRAGGWQAERTMQPGSTMKLVTSVVALERLGPNHRGFTELLATGPVQGGVLQGDLVLRGGGEVELDVPALWELLMRLRESGVQQISGDVLLDRTRYQPARIDLGLPPFDEAPEWPYNVIPDALHLAGSLQHFEWVADREQLRVRSVPALDGVQVVSAMTLDERPCSRWSSDGLAAVVQPAGADGGWRIEFRGSFPRDCTARAELQLLDRDVLAERLLRTLWTGLGGRWTGRVQEAAAPPGARVLLRRDGRRWGELLRQLNKASDNAWTRVLFLEIGHAAADADPAAPTLQRAARVVEQWFDAQGIDRHGLVMDNGSGLSRSERITPTQMARLLEVAWRGPHVHDLLMSLPTAGVDGTMARRLRDSPAAGWARLKTGTLRNVTALAGVVRDADGHDWALAAMLNHNDASRARAALDALVDWRARTGSWQDGRADAGGPQDSGP